MIVTVQVTKRDTFSCVSPTQQLPRSTFCDTSSFVYPAKEPCWSNVHLPLCKKEKKVVCLIPDSKKCCQLMWFCGLPAAEDRLYGIEKRMKWEKDEGMKVPWRSCLRIWGFYRRTGHQPIKPSSAPSFLRRLPTIQSSSLIRTHRRLNVFHLLRPLSSSFLSHLQNFLNPRSLSGSACLVFSLSLSISPSFLPFCPNTVPFKC